MADGRTPDPSSWAYVKGQADSGLVRLDDGVISKLRDANDVVIARLEALQPHIHDMADIPTYVNRLPSSAVLSSKHSASAVHMGDILKAYLDIQRTIGDAFHAAGRAMDRVDQENKDNFDRLNAHLETLPLPYKVNQADPRAVVPITIQSVNDDSGDSGGNQIEDPRGKPVGHKVADLPGELATLGGQNQAGGNQPGVNQQNLALFPGGSARGENADGLNYDDFYQIGQDINYSSPAQKAGMWQWMADELEEAFTSFGNIIQAVANGGGWVGAGAAAATAATMAYVTATENLCTAMRLVGKNLAYTAGWLELTKNSMPTGPDPSGTPQRRTVTVSHGTPVVVSSAYPDQTPIYRQNFRQTYLLGLPRSDHSLPALPTPQSPVNGGDLPGPSSSGGSASTGGGTGGGTGVGWGAGAGPAGLTPLGQGAQSVSAGAVQQNQQQYDQLLAQQKADQQAAQQQATAQQAAYEQQRQQDAQNAAAQQQAAAQQMDQQVRSAVQQAMQTGQQALSGVTQTADKNALQSAAAPLPALASALPGLESSAAAAGRGLAGIGGAGAAGAALSKEASLASRLFPRAATTLGTAVEGAAISRAGLASGMAQASAPGMAGTPGAGAGGQGNAKEYKRPQYRDSAEHLEEALGESPMAVRPVVEK